MTVQTKFTWGLAAAVASLALAAACGSDSASNNNPGSPSGGGGGGGGTPPVATMTITITNSGVNPKDITVARGTQVTFINSSSVPHEMDSNPHPTHGSCPEIESGVGFIAAGQTKQTGNLNTPRTCGYHDHQRDFDTTLQGTIVVQ
jgi:plastocyanin